LFSIRHYEEQLMHRKYLSRLIAAPLVAALFLSASAAIPGQTAPQKKTTKSKPAAALIDLNSATAEELEENLPGVGPVTAKKIVAGRPYSSVDDLGKAGIADRVIEGIRSHVKVEPAAKGKVKAIAKGAAAKESAAESAAHGKVDINSADTALLETLPGVGASVAKAIIAGRPWKKIDDLDSIRGIGTARIDALRPLVTLGSASHTTAEATTSKKGAMAAKGAPKAIPKAGASGKKVDLNTASKDELDSLPGIGPVKAQAIIEARPFKTIEDVMKVSGIKEGEFAKIKDLITVK
jgi:competence protein ComEA